MPQTVSIKSGPAGVGEEASVGPVTGTRNGQPAPLPGPVVFSLDRSDLGELVPIVEDSITFVTRDELVSGDVVLTIESGPLVDTITFTVTAGDVVADTMVVPPAVVTVK